MNWPRVKLRSLVVDYIGGGWGLEAAAEGSEEPASVIRGTDIPGALVGNVVGIPRRFHKKSNLRSRKLQAGDIVFEVSGGSKDQPVGRALLCSTNLLAKIGGDVIPASFCKRVVVNTATARPEYVYYFLKSIYANRSIAQWQVQSTGISNFQFEAFLDECELALPPLDVQEHISGVLSAYDELVTNNTRRISILEEIASRTYEDWFVRFRFPGHEKVTMLETALGPIPEGWHVTTASEAITVNPKVNLPKHVAKPFVPMNSLSENSMLIAGIESREGNSGAKFQNGDTLFARITPCLENGKTGFVQFLSPDQPCGFGSTEFIVLRSRTLCPEYVYLLSRSDAFRQHAIKSMTGASGRQRVRDACFDTFFLAHPEQRVLEEFRKVVLPIFDLIHKLAGKNARLRDMRDLLLPKLISGELELSSTQESAEAIAA